MSPAFKKCVADRDFFSFCTSLKPVELKAMGELSRVTHMGEGEVVYSAGDPGDALYIINRGLVEVVPEAPIRGAPSTYLSRGDIFGDLEALSKLPRTHQVRTREGVSLQCIQRSDFSELSRRVPAFFRYLCEQLAGHIVQARELAVSKSHCLELSGSLTNFDLVTIYQTIMNSLQTGELSILDEGAHPIGSFFFAEGRPRSGQFQHLTGEEALWQLFLSDTLKGSFSFSSTERPIADCVQDGGIERNQRDMLIAACQFRDEFQALKARLPERSVKLRRCQLNFLWPEEVDPELRPLAEEIWQLAYTTPLSLSMLYQKCSVCELKIYSVVDVFIRTELFRVASAEEARSTEQLVIKTS